MTKQVIIDSTVNIINQLPNDKAEEISDFASFIIRRYEDKQLINAIQNSVSESHSFEFLKNEQDLYSKSDLREVYNE